MSGLGAGHDSFYEYLVKSSILFDDTQLNFLFTEAVKSIRYHARQGRAKCFSGTDNYPPIYWNVNMFTGALANYWVDSLQAAWAGVLALNGELEEAVCQHALHFAIWQLFGLMPERYNLVLETPDLYFYPLRPELAESTYLLYRATRHPFYLQVGATLVNDIDNFTREK
ncbi:unnamed protein product [Protopolystoma xenopodis]|uniref:alpha-1,2-Mannosidase n=1 Tax=Protopolystoma xenopodis TaxID=117903 RepID=A0A448WJG7_9PLAT|nr:unnamed protein product [Protopolystoma xenopodis]